MSKKDTRLAASTVSSVAKNLGWAGEEHVLINFKKEGVHMYVPVDHPLAQLTRGTTLVFVREENA